MQEREPAVNPNYDPAAINKEKEKARQEAEAADPLTSGDPANPTRWEQFVTAKVAAAQTQAEADHNPNDPDWIKEVADRVAAAQAKAEEDVKKANKPDDPDLQKKIDEAKAKAKTDTEAAAEEERQALIKADVEAAERAAWKEAKADRQKLIDGTVQAKEAELVKAGGKYYKVDANGELIDPPEFTNDLYEKDADGAIVYKDGKPVYAADVMTYENDKFLLQVEPLKDRRERLMIDPNTVSKKSEVVELNDTVLYGKIQSQRELLTEEGEYASETDLNKNTDPPRLSGDPDASSKRGIPFYQKALNSLARQFAEEFNQANQLPATTVYQMNQATAGTVADTDTFKDADGNPLEYTYTAADGTTQTKQITVKDVTKEVEQEKRDENGNVVLDPNGDPVMEKVRVPYTLKDVANGTITEEEYAQAGAMLNVLAEKGVKDPLYEFYDGGVLFSNNGNTNDPSNITASNITISHGWATETVHILNDKRPDSYREDGSVIHHTSRNENIQHMITLFDKQLEYDARDMQADSAATLPIFKGSFREVYTTIEGILGTEQNITGGKMDNYQLMTLNLENDRQSVSGVDLNDEATNMMQFSKSYAAACRLLTTIDSMLDKLINGTAI